MAPRPLVLSFSPRRRRFYFRVLLTLFALAAPPLFLYATGYRFEGLTAWTKTGGMYVGAEETGVEIYLDGERAETTGIFLRGYYIDDLDPGAYTLRVQKEGYHTWEKILSVEEHLVTEAQAFNLPTEPELTLVPATLVAQSRAATSTRALPNPLYRAIDTAFATATPQTTVVLGLRAATSTATTTKEFRGMELFETQTGIAARWTRTPEDAPFYICARAGVCAERIRLETPVRPSRFDFLPGSIDLALVTLPDGVFVIEIDNRSRQNIQPLFQEHGADFRIIDGGIYVKTAEAEIYKVEL